MFQKIPWVAVNSLTAVLAIAAVVAGASYAGSVVSQNKLIGEDAAKEFAILDAGVREDDTSQMYSRLIRDKGVYAYDVEFYVDTVKYEYEIRGEDGTVLEKEMKEKKKENTSGSAPADAQGEHAFNDERKEPASAADRKESASTADRKESADGKDTLTEKNTERQAAAEAAANPQTETAENKQEPAGAYPNVQPVPDSSSSYISVDQAKQIALDHAGLTKEEVRFTTAKFEDSEDYGNQYEIEFYGGMKEYEYDIDAVTGEILEYDIEVKD
ncbi:MAG: PepSY domain-containing protein [Eubacteriales bacterium]|nr:PepSY domain-containing protein [Eubacteriales bacterium]